MLNQALLVLLSFSFFSVCLTDRVSAVTVDPRIPACCFPALGYLTPSSVDGLDFSSWWCDPATEYAFVGFSYEVTACQSLDKLKADFSDMRYHFNSRYVRIYGVCDRGGFYDDIIEAAWANTLGVHALVWFGFDGTDQWKSRRDTLFATLHSNPKAKYVIRGVQFGSEPLFDNVLPPDQLAAQVIAAKANLTDLHIPVTVSELAYGYQARGGAQDVLDAMDYLNIHILPFFAQNASTASDSWPLVQNDLDWFISHGHGKKMYFDENGWPSVTSSSVQANSKLAVANVQNEHDYFALLDSKCESLKEVVGGGVGWFVHIYSDSQEPGYGIYDANGNLKFDFQPRTSC